MKTIAAFFIFAVFAVPTSGVCDVPEAFQKILNSGFKFKMVTQKEISPIFHKVEIRGSFLFSEKSLSTVLNEIQTEYGEVRVDCSLFVQIAGAILEKEMDEPGFILSIWGFPEIVTSVELGAFHAENTEVHEHLQKTPLLNKAQWVIRVGDDQYMGLATEGVIVRSQKEWIDLTKGGLFKELDEFDLSEDFNDFSPKTLELTRRIVDIHRLQGNLENWKLTMCDRRLAGIHY